MEHYLKINTFIYYIKLNIYYYIMNDDLVNSILNNKKRSNTENNFENINNKINRVINEIYKPYELFKNNDVNREKTLNSLLNNYQYYIPNKTFLVSGDYIRYISKDNKIGNNIYLKKGGFLLDENENNIRILNNNCVLNISKFGNYIFRKLTKNDIFRISISNF